MTTVTKPTAAELELLKVLWRVGPATAKAVHQEAVQARPELASATVLRQLQVMHAKGLVTRDERQRSHVYAASQAKGQLQTSLLRDFIGRAFGGSGKALVLAALQGHVSPAERAEIQRLLAETDTHKDKR
jgi:predicted transcriptional regulator